MVKVVHGCTVGASCRAKLAVNSVSELFCYICLSTILFVDCLSRHDRRKH
jgi:hypothetical protein